jgi:MATE family multidrug resistance protein
MRNGMIQSSAIYAIALAFLVSLFGNHGLWLAVAIFLAARAVTLYLRFPRLVRTIDQETM